MKKGSKSVWKFEKNSEEKVIIFKIDFEGLNDE